MAAFSSFFPHVFEIYKKKEIGTSMNNCHSNNFLPKLCSYEVYNRNRKSIPGNSGSDHVYVGNISSYCNTKTWEYRLHLLMAGSDSTLSSAMVLTARSFSLT